MTKDEWAKVETATKSFFSMAKLKIDDYDIALRLQRVSTYKNVIMVYVNDVFKGEWLANDCEERRRFMCKKERNLATKSKIKHLPKKEQKILIDKYKYCVYSPYWTSFSSLKKHLIKENQSIELVEILIV